MSQETIATASLQSNSRREQMPEKAVRSIASSIFKTLCNEGCNPKDIIGVSSQLLSLVTSELQKEDITR